MDISIITVTWKSKEDISRFISSIEKNLISLSYEVIVVDNNSGDGTPEYVRENFPNSTVIANSDNRGYAGGMNQGYEVAKGRYIAFMNPDMELSEDCFSPLIAKLESEPKIGIIACTLRYADGNVQPTVKRDPSLISQILILTKLHHFIKTPSLKDYLAKDFDYTKEQDVEQLMGAFIMGERARIDEFGPWDNDYPLWWEDLQICADSRDARFVNRYTPVTSVTHFEGKSAAQALTVSKQKRFNKGMRIYFLKNYGIFHYLILLTLHPLSMLLAYISQWLNIDPRTQSRL